MIVYDYCMPSRNGATPGADAQGAADTVGQAGAPGGAEQSAGAPDAAEQSALALDTYSRTVIAVAEALSASVANLQVRRRTRRGAATGAGSGVAISADGFVVTSAHVVEGTRHGVASFSNGHETPVSVVGSDPLSDLAVLRADDDGTSRSWAELVAAASEDPAQAERSVRSLLADGLVVERAGRLMLP